MTIIQFPKAGKTTCEAASASTASIILPVARQPFCRLRFAPPAGEVRAIPPAGALKWLAENLRQGAKISGIDIDGPGDPLADLEATMETLELVNRQYPDLRLSLTTLGIHAEMHARQLVQAGVNDVTLLVDTIDEETAAGIYAWIRPGRKTVPISQAVPMLLLEQPQAIKAFKEAGCAVTIRTTVYPAINDRQVGEIARFMAQCGAVAMQLVSCNTGLSDQEEPAPEPPGPEMMQQLREEASKHLQTTVIPARENRLGIDCASPLGDCRVPSSPTLKPTRKRPNLAVVSLSGMEVDLHLGQAYHVLIYGPREDGLICLLGTRPVPEPGSGSGRWQELAGTLDDCFAILAASAGESPRQILGESGVTVLITDGEIESITDQLYGGGKKKGRGKS